MRITRRAMLAASAAFTGLLSGCQAPQADQTETQDTMTDRTPRHFNDDDELTSRIRLDDDDVIEYIDASTGDRVIEHEPSGNTWRYQSDGTFESPAISTGEVQTDDGKTSLYLTSGTHELSDTLVIDGIRVVGLGDVTLKAVSDTGNGETIEILNGGELHNVTVDTNLQNRSADLEIGAQIRNQSDARISGCDFINFGQVSAVGGAGIFIGFGADGDGSVTEVTVRDCSFSPVSGSSAGAGFGVRVRSDFGGSETSRSDFADEVTGVRVENCSFDGGTYKNCIELSGPVTKDCHMENCAARNVDVTQTPFAINFGPVDCSADVYIENVTHTNSSARAEAMRVIGEEGWTSSNLDVAVTVDGFSADHTTGNRGVHLNDVNDCRIIPTVKNITTNGGPLAAVSVNTDADNSKIVNAYIDSTDRGIDLNECTDTNIINATISATNDDVLEIGTSVVRPRWDGLIRGGPLGGQDLTTVSGQFEGDKALSDGTNTTAYLEATWTGSAWQPSDGSATITPS